jgi:hypothetical protein
LIPAGVE